MTKKIILQLCHSYDAPFADVARQWCVLFDSAHYHVLTVFLCGEESVAVRDLVGGEVLFLNYQSRDLRGLKLKQKKALRALHQQHQFSLIVAQRYKSMNIASAIPNVPIIGVAHAYGVFKRFFRKRFARRLQLRLILVGVSGAIRDDLQRCLPDFPSTKILCLYNHIDTKKHLSGLLPRNKARELLAIAESDLIIANVGRLHPDKDQCTLIRAFAAWLIAPESSYVFDKARAKLLIVGQGRLDAELKSLACELGVEQQVVFVGFVKDAWRYFRAFDLFVLSSDHEPFGMVLLEAMIAGVPVVASNVGGAPEVVADKNCLFAVKNVQALVEAIECALGQPLVSDALVAHVQEYFSDQALQQQFKHVLGTVAIS